VVQTTSGKNAVSSDFFVHATPYSNTNGCVGVMGKGMSKIMSTYSNAVGPKTLSIFGRY
jgi:L,D-peptidoglycan transpeptidase YkuD (ErfK/YbiS/YcfS/YnhG family)